MKCVGRKKDIQIERAPELKRQLVGAKGRKRPKSCAFFDRIFVDRHYMRRALSVARKAAQCGEVPVGAVLVWRGHRVAEWGNRVEADGVALRHAEMLCLEEGSRRLGWRLNEATMYVTLEPCAMCAGALIHCRLGRLVFAARDRERGCCGSMLDLPGQPSLFHHVDVSSGLYEQEASELLRAFFRRRREERRGKEEL
ncbi:MAG: tRNA adenosine(34) deaminase TadA [Ndongobacter sp.]|nr:tRNA adenosine(34) deaminase TadA [Ndongobacter sp.]